MSDVYGPGASGGRPTSADRDPYVEERFRVCETCGEEYSKAGNVSWARWKRSRFCSNDCVSRSKDPPTIRVGPNAALEVPAGGWAEVFVRASDDSWVRVKAKVVAPLAVHRWLGDDSLWTIAHLPTGACFGRFDFFPSAVRAARILRDRDGSRDGGPALWEAETIEEASDILRDLKASETVSSLGRVR